MNRSWPIFPAVALVTVAAWSGCSPNPSADGTASGGGTTTGSGGSAAGGTGSGGVPGTGGATSSSGGVSSGSGGQASTGGETASGGSTASGGGTGSEACSTTSGLEAEFPECFALQIGNSIAAARTDAAIFVATADIQAAHAAFNAGAFVVLDGSTELSSQSIDKDPDGTADEIVFIANLEPNQTKTVAVRYATSGAVVRSYPQRAQALVSPKTGGSWSGDTYTGGAYADTDFVDMTGHIDHDADYLRFEGPGWESDRIGHRVYLDRRNGIDIFGKKTPGMILQDIDYVNEDYSTMQDWGRDIQHVGDALGVGSVGTWQGGAAVKLSDIQSLSVRILESGPVYALLRMSYGGWQTDSGTYNVTADISITAGSRMTKKVVTIDGSIPNLCAGMPTNTEAAVVPPPTTTGFTHLATYGNQSLVPDALGIAVLYRSADELEVVADTVNRLAVMAPTAGQLTYYLLGAWVQEGGGVADQQQFTTFLEATLKELDAPVTVTIL